MTKNLSLFVLALLVSAFLIWEYKVNLIVWALPKVMNVVNPIQENIPTTWSWGLKKYWIEMMLDQISY
ncbi:MAG: hypothetical protein CM15mP17_15510 [Gammaproteobacteria bacterium]|nr:MAG: hypothetical protein CM15mP17_15510 [Gammaproteobacteria bacterium]